MIHIKVYIIYIIYISSFFLWLLRCYGYCVAMVTASTSISHLDAVLSARRLTSLSRTGAALFALSARPLCTPTALISSAAPHRTMLIHTWYRYHIRVQMRFDYVFFPGISVLCRISYYITPGFRCLPLAWRFQPKVTPPR